MLTSYAPRVRLASFLPVSGQEIVNLTSSTSDHSASARGGAGETAGAGRGPRRAARPGRRGLGGRGGLGGRRVRGHHVGLVAARFLGVVEGGVGGGQDVGQLTA